MSTEEPKINPQTAELIAELALEIARRQQTTWDSLDSKAWQVFGSGSIILGLGIAGRVGGLALAIGLAGYAMVAIGSLGCLRLRGFETLPHTVDMWAHYWFRARADVNNTVITALSEAEATNAAHIENKGTALRIAFVALAFETAALALAAAF